MLTVHRWIYLRLYAERWDGESWIPSVGVGGGSPHWEHSAAGQQSLEGSRQQRDQSRRATNTVLLGAGAGQPLAHTTPLHTQANLVQKPTPGTDMTRVG